MNVKPFFALLIVGIAVIGAHRGTADQVVSAPPPIPSYDVQSITSSGAADISGGASLFAASDQFTLTGASLVKGVDFIAYDDIVNGVPGTTSSVAWSITSSPFSTTVLGSGTSHVIDSDLGPMFLFGSSTDPQEFYSDSFAVSPIALTSGVTYYLNLTDAVSTNGDTFWADIAPNGTSRTSNVNSPASGYAGGFESFDMTGIPEPVPELSSMGSLVLLILGMAFYGRAIVRRRTMVSVRTAI